MKSILCLAFLTAFISIQALGASVAIDPPQELYCHSNGKKVPASFAEKRDSGHIVFACNQTQQEIFDGLNTYGECDYQLGWSDGKGSPRFLMRVGPAQPCPSLSFTREEGLTVTHPDLNSMEGEDMNLASLQPGSRDTVICGKKGCLLKACTKGGKKCKLTKARGKPE